MATQSNPEAQSKAQFNQVDNHCALSEKVDGKKHSWYFDGDDPYIICCYCGEVRDALSGIVIKKGSE